MTSETRFTKLKRQAGISFGPATAFPILTRKAGSNPPFGMGVSEHTPGTVDLNLNYDEAIYMLEGDLEIVAGEERHQLEPGDLLWMPRGAQIQYVVRKTARYIYVTSPAGPNS